MANGFDFQGIAQILGSAGASLSGNLPAFQQQQAQQREQQNQLKQARQKTQFTDSLAALGFAKQGRFDLAQQLGQNRLENANQFPGVDFSDTVRLTELAGLASGGDKEAQERLIKTLDDNVQLGRAQGILETPEKFKERILKSSEVVNGQVRVETAPGVFETRDIEGLKKEDPALFAEIRKETRGNIRQRIKDIEKVGGDTVKGFEKVTRLAKEVQGGNLTSVPAMGVALVKLGDPGSIVSPAELQSALQSANPKQAFAQWLADDKITTKGRDILVGLIDPTNPAAINVDHVLRTAKALVSSNIPNLQRRIRGVRESGEILTEFGRESVFTKSFGELDKNLAGILGKELTKPVTSIATADLSSEQFLGLSIEDIEARLGRK